MTAFLNAQKTARRRFWNGPKIFQTPQGVPTPHAKTGRWRPGSILCLKKHPPKKRKTSKSKECNYKCQNKGKHQKLGSGTCPRTKHQTRPGALKRPGADLICLRQYTRSGPRDAWMLVNACLCMCVKTVQNRSRGASRGGQKSSQRLEVDESNCQKLLSPGESKNYQKIVPWEPKIVPKGVLETPRRGPKGLRRHLREGAAKEARSRSLQKQPFCDFGRLQIRFSNF